MANEAPAACPFVALVDDRDMRADQPDHRHRCFAEPEPAPRALAHQLHYCLSPAFPACPTFQDWARREAARPSQAQSLAARGVDGRHAAASSGAAARTLESDLDEPEADGGGGVGAGRAADVPPGSAAAATEPAAGEPRGPAADADTRAPRRAPEPRPARPVHRLRRGSEEPGFWADAPADDDSQAWQAPPPWATGDEGRPVERAPERPAARADESPRVADQEHRLRRSPERRPAADYGVPDSFATARRFLTEPDTGAEVDEGFEVRPAPRDGDAARPENADRARWERAAAPAAPVADPSEPSWDDGPGRAAPIRNVTPGATRGAMWGPGTVDSDAAPRPAPRRSPAGSAAPAGESPVPVIRRPSGVSQARPAAGARGRAVRDPAAPPWEPPRRREAFPDLRTRVGLPQIPRLALAAAAVALAAIGLFLLPAILFPSAPRATPSPSVPASAGASVSTAPTARPSPTPVVYTVQEGDTFSGIAAKYGVTIDALKKANPKVRNPDVIKPGDKLTIPLKATPVPVDVGVSASPGASAAP